MIADRIILVTNKNERDKSDLRSAISEIGKTVQKEKEINKQKENILKENTNLSEKSKTLCDELNHKTVKMEKDINEAKAIKQEEIYELGGELKKEYEDRLRNALAGLRDVNENQLVSDKDEFKEKYEKS